MDNKKQKLFQPNERNNNNNNNENLLKRDSFSGRICDDLCEVLLSYLSFEDKIRFECVSKQWQKCVYEKQHSLVINECEDKDKEKPGDGRCLAHTAKLKGILIDIVNHRQGRLRRAAPRHRIGFGEELEGADHLDDKEKKGGGANQRHGDAPKALEGIRSIDIGGVIEFLGNPL